MQRHPEWRLARYIGPARRCGSIRGVDPRPKLDENLAGNDPERIGPYPGTHRTTYSRIRAARRPDPKRPHANRRAVAVGDGAAEEGTIFGCLGSARSLA